VLIITQHRVILALPKSWSGPTPEAVSQRNRPVTPGDRRAFAWIRFLPNMTKGGPG